MPTVLQRKGFRFFFYSNENNEPMHIHVTKADANEKIWLEPTIMISYAHGFTNAEQEDIDKIISENYEQIKKYWNAYFSK